MKASTKYNDFIGTAAADISSFTNFNKLLEDHKVDTARYEPIGIRLFHGDNTANESDDFFIQVICIDKEKSTDKNNFIVAIGFDNEITYKDFFRLFKRFEVLVTSNHKDSLFQSFDINEEVHFTGDK